ncbi:MAG TPA: 30S ribosomal protein S1 [Terriglobales bacterium]|jgi:small subunit ribosomal protein S1|nr:30S ribosomal protein S1 [Terriglobales bacterium]
MSNQTEPGRPGEPQSNESFGDILKQFERDHSRKKAEGSREATVISVTAESVVLDIGFKTEGVLPIAELRGETLQPGDKLNVAIKGRDPEGYYLLTRGKVSRPTDWDAFEKAFKEKSTILGTVTGIVKGGASVDVGVRAFMPASRSGVQDAAELEKLVEQEIRCRIIKLDVADEDIVVDRRVILEEEERTAKGQRYAELKEGDKVTGTVRSLTDYGAFVDIGRVDALLHVSDISWARVNSPADALSVGQEVEAKVLKLDTAKQKISIGLKQLQPQPWDSVASKYKTGERVRGTVSRLADFGAFVELEPGVEGLIHISEMSWVKKVRTPADLLKAGDIVEAIILGINPGEKRISLGLKQALGDPWADAQHKFPVDSIVEGQVVSLQKFGAFVQLAEGIEGMVHVSDISAEKRINHPSDVFKIGQVIKAQVLALDVEKRRLKLGIKQMVPTSIDEYLAERKVGDVVSGRVADISGNFATVELGEGIRAVCRVGAGSAKGVSREQGPSETTDLKSLTSMLAAKWKSGPVTAAVSSEITAGQVRSFRVTKLDPASKKIEVEIT